MSYAGEFQSWDLSSIESSREAIANWKVKIFKNLLLLNNQENYWMDKKYLKFSNYMLPAQSHVSRGASIRIANFFSLYTWLNLKKYFYSDPIFKQRTKIQLLSSNFWLLWNLNMGPIRKYLLRFSHL